MPIKANRFRVVLLFRRHKAVTHSGVRARCFWAGELNQLQHKSFDSVDFQGVASLAIGTAKSEQEGDV